MVRMVSDGPSKRKGQREVTFAYEYNNGNDVALVEKIVQLCLEEQQRCENCIHFYYNGCPGGYMACACKIHGNLEYVEHPHYDMDGSKCEDYISKNK